MIGHIDGERNGARVLAGAALIVACVTALAGCAGRTWNGPMPIGLAAQTALPERGQVSVRLEPGGVAVLRGWTESEIGEQAVVREMRKRPEVRQVVNLLHRSYFGAFR